uniref:Uncharacterized protein n=1 Tax=Lygus hesperus TaxID=30085 RepID=A0A146LMB5_LYGHE
MQVWKLSCEYLIPPFDASCGFVSKMVGWSAPPPSLCRFCNPGISDSSNPSPTSYMSYDSEYLSTTHMAGCSKITDSEFVVWCSTLADINFFTFSFLPSLFTISTSCSRSEPNSLKNFAAVRSAYSIYCYALRI